MTDVLDRCNEDGALRLVGGRGAFEGRVEFCFREIWGTVCDDRWDTRDAEVVCRQLGFSTTGALALSESEPTFGQGASLIFLDEVGCTGGEERLIFCSHRGPVGNHDCTHAEDAGVICPQDGADGK